MAGHNDGERMPAKYWEKFCKALEEEGKKAEAEQKRNACPTCKGTGERNKKKKRKTKKNEKEKSQEAKQSNSGMCKI